MRKLKIGIIGCGGIAKNKHLPSLALLADQVELVAFCDIEEERAVWAAKEYGSEGAQTFANYEEVLKNSSIDVIHVLTPNVSHCEITIAALEAGKHVMCEKPMAMNSIEARKMIDTANRTGKKLTIGYQNRFREDSQILYKACRNGELGDIYFAEAHAIRRRAVPTWGVFPDKSKQGGGPLIDIGTHALDLALWTMDNYKPVLVVGSSYQKLKDKPEGNIFGEWDPATYEVEDSAFGYIKMENGATIYLEASWALNILTSKEAQVTLCGTDAGAEMFDQKYVKFNTARHGQLVEISPSNAGNVAYFEAANNKTPGYLEAKQWIDAILYDKEPLVSPEQAFIVTQVLEAIYKSAETGKAIEL